MHRPLRNLMVLCVSAASLFASAARADIPAGYTGTPYLGTPKVIPGRVNLVDCDLGGEGVAYHADHRRSNSAGYEPISGNDYRPDDKDLPNICKTNKQNPDSMLTDGSLYPPTSPTKEEYYIGYAHAVDWVKITVDVKTTGTYNVSSIWASAGAQWGLSIWFNDGKGTPDPQRPKDGVNKTGIVEMPGTSDYHKWKAYPNFTQVKLDAGVQVMTFHLEKHDHLQYGFLQFDLVGGAATDGGVPAGDAGANTGGAGTGGSAGTGGGAGTTGAAGAGSATGAAGTGADPSGAAGTGSATGVTGAAGTGGGMMTGAAGTAPRAKSSGGCSLASQGGGSAGAGLLLLGCALLARRRSRSRA